MVKNINIALDDAEYAVLKKKKLPKESWKEFVFRSVAGTNWTDVFERSVSRLKKNRPETAEDIVKLVLAEI